jgi:hypothetical protein
MWGPRQAFVGGGEVSPFQRRWAPRVGVGGPGGLPRTCPCLHVLAPFVRTSLGSELPDSRWIAMPGRRSVRVRIALGTTTRSSKSSGSVRAERTEAVCITFAGFAGWSGGPRARTVEQADQTTYIGPGSGGFVQPASGEGENTCPFFGSRDVSKVPRFGSAWPILPVQPISLEKDLECQDCL